MHGPAIGYHPTRFNIDSLELLEAEAFRNWDRAPAFHSWLVDFVHSEQKRRLGFTANETLEPQLAILPLDWSGDELGKALKVATVLSYCNYEPKHCEAGTFLDRVVMALAALAANRLSKGWKHHGGSSQHTRKRSYRKAATEGDGRIERSR